jgi:glucose-1-phosphate thymidylyltransferase
MNEGSLKVNILGRGMAWLDTGTHESMLKASNFVEAVQSTQGTYIACLEEIAFRNGWINKESIQKLAQPLLNRIWTVFAGYICGKRRYFQSGSCI